MDSNDPATTLHEHLRLIPQVLAMQVQLAGERDGRLCLRASLGPNVNDKGTAFGGSLVSLMTLAGWCLVSGRLEQAGLQAEVYVADSDIRYKAPLRADLEAEATLAEGDWPAFLRTLRQRGRARVTLRAQVPLPDGGVATEMQARYVAILRPSAAA